MIDTSEEEVNGDVPVDGPASGEQATPAVRFANLIESKLTFFRDSDSHRLLALVPGMGAVDAETKGFRSVAARIAGARPQAKAFGKALNTVLDEAAAKAPEMRAASFAYAPPNCSALYISAAGGNHFKITATAASFEPDSRGGVVFMPEDNFCPITAGDWRAATPQLTTPLAGLRRILLDRLPVMPDLEREEGVALIAALWFTPFLSPLAKGRPIFLFTGEPGSGKSVTQRIVAKLFYGPNGDTTGGASKDRALKDLAAAAVHTAFTLRDDFSDLPDGAADTLNRMATGGALSLAEFHETLSLVTYPFRSSLCLSAHRPKWLNRRDLLSRLVVARFSTSAATNLTERDRVGEALLARPVVWLETMRALKAVLATDYGAARKPITRFDDWEKAVRAVLEGAGLEEALCSALRKMLRLVRQAAVDADPFQQLLVDFAARHGDADFLAADIQKRLLQQLGDLGPDRMQQRGPLANPQKLALMFARIENEGSAVVRVTRKAGPGHTRLWRISLLDDERGGGELGEPGLHTSPKKEKEEEGEEV